MSSDNMKIHSRVKQTNNIIVTQQKLINKSMRNSYSLATSTTKEVRQATGKRVSISPKMKEPRVYISKGFNRTLIKKLNSPDNSGTRKKNASLQAIKTEVRMPQKTYNNDIRTVKTSVNTRMVIPKGFNRSLVKKLNSSDSSGARKQNASPQAIKTEVRMPQKTYNSGIRTAKKPANTRTVISKGFNRSLLANRGIIKDSTVKIQRAINSQDDTGAKTVSAYITIGSKGIKALKTAQSISPYVLKTAVKTVENTYKGGIRTVKAVRAVKDVATKIRSGSVVLNQQALLQIKTAAIKTAVNTRLVKNVTHTVNTIKTAAHNVKHFGMLAKRKSINIIRTVPGVLNGTVKLRISPQSIKKFRKIALKGVKYTGRIVGRGIKTGAVKGLKTGVWTGKSLYNGTMHVGNALMNSDDTGIQALGTSIKATDYTIKAIRTSPKVIRSGVKGVKTAVQAPRKTGRAVYRTGREAYRTGRSVVRTAKMIRKTGIKSTIRFYQQNFLTAFKKAGGSVVNILVKVLQKVAMKFAIPVALLALVFIFMTNIISAPVSSVGAIFGGYFVNKDTGEDVEVHNFLTNKVSQTRGVFIAEVVEYCEANLKSNGGTYHYVRLYVGGAEIEATVQQVSDAIYTVDELVAFIEPIFKTIILSKYELEPTQEEIDNTFIEIWQTLIKMVSGVPYVEYCYGETEPHECGSFHANPIECVNNDIGIHTSYKCYKCCYILTHTNDDGTTYTTEECSRYNNCLGHRILPVEIEMEGYYALLAKYYTDPIDELANIPLRTIEEEELLQTLISDYELCLEYIAQFHEEYGIGAGDGDISGVVFINGSRPGNYEMVSVAESQLGNIGGFPYWNWYGFGGRVEWCACFVSWVANQNGYISSGAVPKFASTRAGVSWFQGNGQWASGGYTQPVGGDLIFYDWDGDGLANHVGIVVGNDGEYVYTVEGNSGDKCRRRSYRLDSSVILGYGLPNY